ncbi:MAG: hypothetical protein IPM68_08275 [Flavobacteriales bacterium]|nr:hypothetical protein [Flavobacteriales bacterium]
MSHHNTIAYTLTESPQGPTSSACRLTSYRASGSTGSGWNIQRAPKPPQKVSLGPCTSFFADHPPPVHAGRATGALPSHTQSGERLYWPLVSKVSVNTVVIWACSGAQRNPVISTEAK